MPPIASYWHSLIARHAPAIKAAWKEASKAVEANITKRAQGELQPVLARNPPRQSLHPAARIRQSQSRWYSTKRTFTSAVRRFTASAHQQVSHSGPKYDRASFPQSRTSAAVGRSAGRAPFASTLRPNLTGGTLGRTAGGYSLGGGRTGGARYFSHGPASQAQVVQNVSQAVRAFFISGHKAQYNGVSPVTGEKRYKSVTALQAETDKKMRSVPKATPGSYIDFTVNPTITALTPLSAVTGYSTASTGREMEHLNTEGLLDILSVDFSRALRELATVLNDLKRLSALGDLPVTYQASSLRIHFPGCDADSVERLCEELNLQRGVVVQDEVFDAFAGTEIALLFPFAPTRPSSDIDAYFDSPAAAHKAAEPIDWRNMCSPAGEEEDSLVSSPSDAGFEELSDANPWLSSPSGYESVHYSSERSRESSQHSPLEYQDFEGIYRFIAQCDDARRV